MPDPAKSWSKSLQDTTRRVIGEHDFASDPINLKNTDGRFGALAASEVMAGRLNVAERGTGVATMFADVEELVRAGWSVD